MSETIKFYTALMRSLQLSSQGPLNSSAIFKDKNLVLQKASSLLGYQNYLTEARAWKATRKSVPRSFEREVQTYANQALVDVSDFATATLRMTRHFKQAGELDRMLSSWVAAVQASGPVQVQDLWSDIVNASEARQMLRDEGLTDKLFAAVDEIMKKVEGKFLVEDGKLEIAFNMAEQAGTQRVVMKQSDSRMPKTLPELLRRGQFEQIVARFERGEMQAFTVVAGPAQDFQLDELMMAGAILSVQSIAQHKRKLEDTGLATYTGHEPATIAIVATWLIIGGAVLWFGGGYLMKKLCEEDADTGHLDELDWCTVATVLYLLGIACLLVGTILQARPVGVFFGGAYFLRELGRAAQG
jgi:hypothetical protein